MVARYQWMFVALAVCALSLLAPTALAQFGLPGSDRALLITLAPLAPNAGDTVRVTVHGTFVDVPASTVVWQLNGKDVARGKGVDSASVKMGDLGTENHITVTVLAPDGTSVGAEAVIIPTELDVLVDSDSYTPPFYKGRPRPSAGTNLHMQALPRFKRNGAFLPASALTYTWRRNDEVLGDISGLGKSTAIIPVQHLFGSDTISVEARSDDGTLSHIATFTIPATEPVLTLYEDHPLYGMMFHRALGASTFVPETEMTFAAIPFFAQASTMDDPLLNYTWQVNGSDIAASKENPDELTINAQNSSGIALVELGLTHASNFYLSAKGEWNILFSSGTTGVSDQFHPAQ